jgi:hypothetical protein
MSTATIRQQLVDKLKLRLARIRIANGFQTDIGETDAEDWPIQFQEDELRDKTRLGIFDLTNKSDQTELREKKIPNTLPMQVRIFHSRDTTPAELRVMIADVMQAIGADDQNGNYEPTFDGLAIDTKPDEDGFIIPRETFSIDGAAISFTVEFLSAPFNAYE